MKNSLLDRIIRNIRTKKVIQKIKKGSIIVDLGCDEGHFLISIKDKIKKGYGFDKFIKNHQIGKVIFKKVDLEKNIPKIKTDYVTLLAVIEHLNNPDKVLKNSYNILKKGGTILLTTPSPSAKFVLESLAKLKLIDENQIKDHKHYFSKKEIYNLLKKQGFRKIKVNYFELGMNLFAIAVK